LQCVFYSFDRVTVLQSTNITFGSAVKCPTPPEREGYEFKYWVDSSETVIDNS